MWAMQAIGRDAGLPDEFYGVPTPAMAEKSPALDKMRDEVFTRIILGEPVDATFDQFVKDWKNLGGDDITKEVNAWYTKQK
jgi:putative aldouronate transport system substrate-binding protein